MNLHEKGGLFLPAPARLLSLLVQDWEGEGVPLRACGHACARRRRQKEEDA